MRITKAMEDEINVSLGSLLGMLEVLSIDADEPLTPRQQRSLSEALRMGDALRIRVEALTTLLADEADPRFAKTHFPLRRLIDHAVRAAGWAASEQRVELRLPPSGAWEDDLVWVDAPRTDRALRGMTDALVAGMGAVGGVVELSVERHAHGVRLVFTRRPGGEPAPLAVSALVWSGWQRLIELQGGRIELEREASRLTLELPKPPAQELR